MKMADYISVPLSAIAGATGDDIVEALAQAMERAPGAMIAEIPSGPIVVQLSTPKAEARQ